MLYGLDQKTVELRIVNKRTRSWHLNATDSNPPRPPPDRRSTSQLLAAAFSPKVHYTVLSLIKKVKNERGKNK